jgi:low affinity Fe/Cu permease
MNHKDKGIWFDGFASKATKATGSSVAFIIACSLILIWGITGPIFNYSPMWQMAINTFTTIVTFLMVFLIQKAQNKDSISIQIKLNELVAADANASNRIISIEDLSENELIRLNEYYTKLALLTQKEKNLKAPHSIEDTSILEDEKDYLNKKINSIVTK